METSLQGTISYPISNPSAPGLAAEFPGTLSAGLPPSYLLFLEVIADGIIPIPSFLL